MSSSRTGPPLRVAPSGLFSWLPLWSSPLLLFSLQVPLFLPAHRVTTSRSACLELRGHDSMFPPSRCAIRGYNEHRHSEPGQHGQMMLNDTQHHTPIDYPRKTRHQGKQCDTRGTKDANPPLMCSEHQQDHIENHKPSRSTNQKRFPYR